MPPSRRLLLACAVAFCIGPAAGQGASGGLVEHAVVTSAAEAPAVQLWRDPSTGLVALQHDGEASLVLVQGRTVDHVDDGHLTELATYRSAHRAWAGVELRFALAQSTALAALAAGDQVRRPALMDVPRPSPDVTFTRVWDYDTSLAALQRSVRFPVPAPGARLAGLQLADAARVRTRSAAEDTGLTAMIAYSSDPARLGTDDRELILNAAPPTSGMGAANAALFKTLRDRMTGHGWEARFAKDGAAILRRRGSYVVVTASWAPTQAAWRAIFARIAA